MAATASRLTSVSRRLTAERGLHGFTIEELCAEVGVSRRTFFNYFPSKDEAVLGIDEVDDAKRLEQQFSALGSRGWSAVIGDLVQLAVDHAEAAGFRVSEHSDFVTAIEREPRLLARVVGMTRDHEQALVLLVAAREGAASDDPRARAVVTLFFAVLRAATERILQPGVNDDFGTALYDSLAAIREVAAAPHPRKDHA